MGGREEKIKIVRKGGRKGARKEKMGQINLRMGKGGRYEKNDMSKNVKFVSQM